MAAFLLTDRMMRKKENHPLNLFTSHFKTVSSTKIDEANAFAIEWESLRSLPSTECTNKWNILNELCIEMEIHLSRALPTADSHSI